MNSGHLQQTKTHSIPLIGSHDQAHGNPWLREKLTQATLDEEVVNLASKSYIISKNDNVSA